jgi:CRISPR-associated endonuclease/helicase Cas3
MAPASALLHSRAECDLEDVRGTQHEDLEETLEHIVRIESLAAWDMPLVICTVDQVLGLIQNNRRALFSIPSIANGAFVFDEIHQYDDRVFRALLRFLEAFPGAPTLLMTASLPAARLEAIRSKLRQLGSDLRVIEGPVELENVKRYLVEPPQEEPPWTAVKETLFRGGKVLWVANTVARCVAFAQAAEEKGLCPLAYHSRYRYCDRAEKHKDVVNAFRSSEAALAITTQVCEVSLDLSADLLVSDLAPTPSLIQRMGRLNRRASPNGTEQPKPLIVLEPPRATPYEDAEMEQARAWLSELGYGPLSQADLSRAFEEMAKDDVPGGIKSAWLDGGPFAAGGALHEASYSIPVVRREDEPRCLDERNRPVAREVTRYAVPMLLGPVSREIGGWKRLGFAFVAPEGRIDYSTQWGAKWAQT